MVQKPTGEMQRTKAIERRRKKHVRTHEISNVKTAYKTEPAGGTEDGLAYIKVESNLTCTNKHKRARVHYLCG